MSDFDVVLHGWAGEDFTVDRIGRDPVHVVSPALVLGRAVQPAVLAGVTVKHPEVRDKGLLARFLWAMPNMSHGEVRIGHRKIDPPAVPDVVRKEYRDLVYGHAVAPTRLSPRRLSLTPEATEAFRAWRAEAEVRRRPDGDLAAIPEWAGKIDGHTLRLAALLHLAEGSGSLLIGAPLMRAAVEIMRYCVPHAVVVEVLAGGRRGTGDAHALLSWIKRTGRTEFSVREAQGGLHNRFHTTDEVRDAIKVLADKGWVRPVPVTREPGSLGQSPSPRFEVHVNALVVATVSPLVVARLGWSAAG